MITIYNQNQQIAGYLNPATGLIKTSSGEPFILIWPDGDVQFMSIEASNGYGSIDSGDNPYSWDGKAVRRENDAKPLFYRN